MAEENKEAFGWNEKVEVSEGGSTLLPKGPAFFEITKLDRQRKEFGKFGTCNVAVMTFVCAPAEGDGSAEISVQFALVRALGWKIVQLATACGFRKHGESSEIDPRWWAKFEGASGRCVIDHRTYKNKNGADRTANEIVEFIAAEEKPTEDNLQF